jgi:hypothetical protein
MPPKILHVCDFHFQHSVAPFFHRCTEFNSLALTCIITFSKLAFIRDDIVPQILKAEPSNFVDFGDLCMYLFMSVPPLSLHTGHDVNFLLTCYKFVTTQSESSAADSIKHCLCWRRARIKLGVENPVFCTIL